MTNDIKELSLDNLFTTLHNLMVNLVRDIDSVINDNEEVGLDDVKELREHINQKLTKSEEIYDNQKLLKLLNLFSEDKAVLEIIKEDSEEWVKLLEAIESSLMERGSDLTEKEKKEVKQISKLTGEIKQLIRRTE